VKDDNETKLHITQQFRSGRAMVYDLRDRTSRLTLRVFERQSAAEPGDFRVEAATSGASDAVVVTAWGATRAEALREVSRSWADTRLASGLPTFDWDAITRALTAVRAV
jgi:hypothetical protein